MRRQMKGIVTALSAIALVSIATIAFAGWPMGYGYGMHRGMGYGPGAAGTVDTETLQEFDQARQAFFQETAGLRDQIHQKRLALENAFAAETPNREEVRALQRDLSNLRAQFQEKRLEHRLDMRNRFPELAAGYGAGNGCRGRGHGRMRGHHGPMASGPGAHMGYGQGMNRVW